MRAEDFFGSSLKEFFAAVNGYKKANGSSSSTKVSQQDKEALKEAMRQHKWRQSNN